MQSPEKPAAFLSHLQPRILRDKIRNDRLQSASNINPPDTSAGCAPQVYRPNLALQPQRAQSPAPGAVPLPPPKPLQVRAPQPAPFRLEQRLAPPVYRPNSAPPVLIGNAPSIGHRPYASPKVSNSSSSVQTMEDKKKKQQKEKKDRESREQSAEARKVNALRKTQTRAKNPDVQKSREDAARKEKKASSHLHGGQNSGKNNNWNGVTRRVNQAASSQRRGQPSDAEAKPYTIRAKAKDEGPRPDTRSVRTAAGNVASFKKSREEAIAAYINHCKGSELRSHYNEDKFEQWAQAWAEQSFHG